MEAVKPEKQRIAIAETLGWKDCEYIEGLRDVRGITPSSWKGDGIAGFDVAWIPDYLNDLNAMHEAVISKLNGPAPDGWMFIDNLRIACEIPQSNTCMALVCATAAQRAEAFLRTIGKWVEL